jgi:hypothetical protein
MNPRYGLGTLGLCSVALACLTFILAGFPNEAVFYGPWGSAATAGFLVWLFAGLAAAARLCFRGKAAASLSIVSLAGFNLYWLALQHASIPAAENGFYVENAWQMLRFGLLAMALLDVVLALVGSRFRRPAAKPAAEPRFRPF